MLASAKLDQFTQGLTHHTREFEPMPAEPAGQGHAGIPRMPIDDKVPVRTVGVQTGSQGQKRTIRFPNEVP
jgi:hypothetical protein